MMNRNTTRNASFVWLILKGFLVVILVRVILTVAFFFAFFAAIAFDGASYDYEGDRCEDYYQSGDYAGLCEYLNQHNLGGEKFEIYHEAVEGAILRSEYLQWSAAAEQGMDGAAQKAEEILSQLQTLSEQAKYPENREIFAGFLRELQN